jgi:hypothetical protein
MRLKSLYLNNELIGSVPTWSEAAQMLSVVLQREVSDFEAMTRGSEGPDGFYVKLARLKLVSTTQREKDQ